MLPLVAVCGLGLAQSALAQVSRTPWEMHEGQDVIKLDAELPSNGALPENGYIGFQHAEIPVEGSYVTRASAGTPSATTDLKALVTTGRNRVVITQVDWCPVGNQL